MRSHEHIVLDDTVVTNVISGPQDDIAADFTKWLHYIVLKDKGVFTD